MTSTSDSDGEPPAEAEPAPLSLFDFDDPPPAPPPIPDAETQDAPDPAQPDSESDSSPADDLSSDAEAAVPLMPTAAAPEASGSFQEPPTVPADDPTEQPDPAADASSLSTSAAEVPSAAPAAAEHARPPVDEPPVGNLLDGVVGQPTAVARLEAALESPLPSYLFVGPAGAGLRDAACRFAGEMLAARSATPERERRLALAEQHPDLVVFDRVGAAVTAEQARGAVRAAAEAPVVGDQKVIVLCDVDRAALSAPILLKSVEEPPPSCIFVLLAEEVNRSMETLASRCVRVDFEALGEAELRALLVGEGVEPGRAAFAAAAADGAIDRARLLASDEDAAARIEMWRGLRRSLNGTASTAMAAVDAALEATEQAAAPLEARHTAEREAADEQAELYGTNAGRSTLDERHRREQRRVRADELAMGLSVLSAQIRDEAGSGTLRPATAADQLTAIGDAAEALRFNANQRLALSSLFIRLGRHDRVARHDR